MPAYELVLVIQKLERQGLKEALKRTANYIFEEDGILRKIENLGFRELPYSMRAKGKKHHHANYFIFNYDSGVQGPKKIAEKLKLDLDIVKATYFLRAMSPMSLHREQPKRECTLHVDLLPAPLRPTVKALQEIARKKTRRYRGKNADDSDFLLF